MAPSVASGQARLGWFDAAVFAKVVKGLNGCAMSFLHNLTRLVDLFIVT